MGKESKEMVHEVRLKEEGRRKREKEIEEKGKGEQGEGS